MEVAVVVFAIFLSIFGAKTLDKHEGRTEAQKEHVEEVVEHHSLKSMRDEL